MNDHVKIFRLLDPSERKRVGLLLVCSVMTSVIDVVGMSSILPFLTVATSPELIEKSAVLAHAYKMSNVSSPADFIVVLGLVALTVVILGNVLAFITQWAVIWYSFDLGRRLSARLFLRYLHQPYQFFLSRNSFNLMLNATGEVEGFVNGILLPGMQVVARTITALILILLVIIYDPVKAGIFLITVGGSYSLIFVLSRKFVSRFGELSHAANAARYRKAKEAFGAIKELRILGREEHYATQFLMQNRVYGRNLALHSIIAVAPRYVLEMTGIAALLIVFLYGARSAQGIAATVPTLALYAIAGYRLLPAFQTIFSNLTVIRFNLPSLKVLVHELSNLKTEGRAKVIGKSSVPLNHSIRFVDVAYRYAEAEEPALRDINIVIPARKTIGIVGSSGAGKSTFIDVLTGLLPIQSGTILIDDMPLSEWNAAEWRKSIGYVAQSIYLADDSIRRNIAFGISDAEIDQDLLEKAAKLASIHNFIVNEMPRGYDTVIGENGTRLSGGQRQRLGIARALYREPSVLVFDEATSALDGITESAVIDAIRDLSTRKTIVIIAHRLVTVQECDQIYLLDKGRVSDHGNYQDLLRRSSLFRQMARVANE